MKYEMEKSFYSLSEKIISSLEIGWGFKFPKSYKLFLENYNGGIPKNRYFHFKDSLDGSAIDTIFGIVPEKYFNAFFYYNIMYCGRIPLNTFPIAHDSFGNLILLSVKGQDYGKVYFWDHEQEADTNNGEVPGYENLTLIADSFEEFMGNLKDSA